VIAAAEIDISLLEDGKQPAERVADQLATFLDAARQTLDIALYDLNLQGTSQDRIGGAMRAAAARGVAVRLAYNVDFPNPIPVPPPGQPNLDFIAGLGIPHRAIPGVPALMHHKYVVRDAGTPHASVWTGSTNWTNDSWTREENVILRLPAPALADDYRQDFEQLWTTGRVALSGKVQPEAAPLQYGGQSVSTRVFFSPGRGRAMAHLVAEHLGRARHRVRICSPVISAGPILGTLSDLADKAGKIDISGVFDRTQMDEVLRQWQEDPHAAWKAPAFRSIIARLPFASKVSTPYAPGRVHDYMHAKVTVVDNAVLTGSYNLSHSGEENAENLLELYSRPLADVFVSYIDRLAARYGGSAPVSLPSTSTTFPAAHG